jgi:hypothetical protein
LLVRKQRPLARGGERLRSANGGAAGGRADRRGASTIGRGVALPALTLYAALAFSGCAPPGRAQDPPVVQANRITLDGRPEDLAQLGALEFEAGFALGARDPRFGGLSGLWLAPDGTQLIAASDRGTLWRATLDHAADGRLIGVRDWQAVEPGHAPDDSAEERDAEALAPDGAGGLVIAYEGTHRLRRLALDDLTAPPAALPTPAALDRPSNRGIEALAALPDGALLALAEGVFAASGDLLAWRIEGDRVLPLSYSVSQGYVPTGADRLEDTLFVVERRFSLLDGFATRIVTLGVAEARAGASLVGRRLAELRAPLLSENFEAIAARRGADGRVLLYLVSDDNFIALQRTLLLQLSLTAPGFASAGGSERVDRAHQRPER